MIEFVPVVSNRAAPRFAVTGPGRIRSIRSGLIEVTMVHSRVTPSGLIIYEEAGRIIWPVQALPEARVAMQIGWSRLLKDDSLH